CFFRTRGTGGGTAKKLICDALAIDESVCAASDARKSDPPLLLSRAAVVAAVSVTGPLEGIIRVEVGGAGCAVVGAGAATCAKIAVGIDPTRAQTQTNRI